jgi:hypothetical protein
MKMDYNLVQTLSLSNSTITLLMVSWADVTDVTLKTAKTLRRKKHPYFMKNTE